MDAGREAEAALRAAFPDLPGTWMVDFDKRGWRVLYWWSRTRTIVHSKPTPEAAVEAAIAAMQE